MIRAALDGRAQWHTGFAAIICLFLAWPVQASVLEAWRMGVTQEKTRLVFQLDQRTPYQVSTGERSIQVSFERLTPAPNVLDEAAGSKGGLLEGVSHSVANGKTIFQLSTSAPFHIQYFDLNNPSRVVIDLYPAQEASSQQAQPPSPAAETDQTAQLEQRKSSQPEVSAPQGQARDKIETASPPESAAVSRAEPLLADAKDRSDEAAASPGNGFGWAYVVFPLLVLALVAFWLIRSRQQSKLEKALKELDLRNSELDSESINFQTLMKQEESHSEETSGAVAAASAQASAEMGSDLREQSTSEPVDPGIEPSMPQAQVPSGDVSAQLNVEDGTLIWPVHLLDGGRVGRIMVVDDEPDIAIMLEEYLVEAGYEVQALTDGQRALEKFWEWHPDLLILDVIMSGLSGVDFAREVRKDDRQTKVIFLSGRSERSEVAASFEAELQAGAFEFFRKPIDLQQIGGRVRDYFSSAQAILHLNLQSEKEFSTNLQHLSPHQLLALHSFVWDRIFEAAAGLLGRRIESMYISDRMEPATNYMRRMGCQERRDYCIARVCIVSNPSCAANRLRAELGIMRQILVEFREEYLMRIERSIGAEDLSASIRGKRRESRRAASSLKSVAHSESADSAPEPPPRQTLDRLVNERKR